ncbi:MAG: reductive dehalogenase [Candidatus Kariarchaeaceae archaeon]|jgi:reductive dehalogenase
MAVTTQKMISIDYDICDPSKCQYQCLEVCHVNKRNPENPAIIKADGKPDIMLSNCTLCGRCERSCPLNAISIIGKEITSKSEKKISDKIVDLKVWKKSPYIIDEDAFVPFNQENTIFARVGNDPNYEYHKKGIYVNHEDIFALHKSGYNKIDAALGAAAWTVHDKFRGAYSWGKLEPSPDLKFDAGLVQKEAMKIDIDDPEKMTEIIKHAAKAYGAALVGTAKLNRNWIYTHDRAGKKIEIPEHITNVVVLAVEMDLEALQTSPAYVSAFATGNGYSRMAFIQSCLAEFIRELGYDAIPAGNGTGLSIPLAIDAGLGQYGRHGLLITPEFGSNVRICKVFTNIPLVPDEPIDIGALDFCRKCMRCADSCPSQSISYKEDPEWAGSTISNNDGIYKWYVNVDSCYGFWTKNGNDCSNCITSCPFTKNRHWSHAVARFFIKRMPFLNRLWVKIDHWMGYGKQRDPEEFWDIKHEFIHDR